MRMPVEALRAARAGRHDEPASVALVEGSRGCMTGVSGPRRFVLWVFCQL